MRHSAVIYSRKHRFAFIKGRKVASTSIEIALSAICGDNDVITPITPIDERARLEFGGRPPQNYGANPAAVAAYIDSVRSADSALLPGIEAPKGIVRNHSSLKELIGFVGGVPGDFLIFASERSPYMKVISSANLRTAPKEYHKTGIQVAANRDEIRTVVDRMIHNGRLEKLQNYRLYVDERGKLRTSIVRYENLEEDLRSLLSSRGIPALPPLPHAKRGLSLNSADVREYLSAAQIRAINEQFAIEFKTFGYEMITP